MMANSSKKTSDEKLVPKGIDVTVADKKFNIQQFVLRDRIKFTRLVTDILNEGINVEDMLNKKSLVLNLVNKGSEKVIEIYEFVLKEKKEWLEESMTIEDEINVLEAIVEVNKIPLVISRVKELLDKKIA